MEKQEIQPPIKKYPVNYWVDEETNARLEKLTHFRGGRTHIARTALLKELDVLESQQNPVQIRETSEQKAS